MKVKTTPTRILERRIKRLEPVWERLYMEFMSIHGLAKHEKSKKKQEAREKLASDRCSVPGILLTRYRTELKRRAEMSNHELLSLKAAGL